MKYDKKWHERMLRKRKEELIYLLKDALKLEAKRTSAQNRALHLLFTQMADQFNNIGFDCTIEIQNITFTSQWTRILFKSQMWKPIQKALYGTDSTTELTTKQINGILDVLIASFAQTDIDVVFPSEWSLYVQQMEKQGRI